MSSEDPLVLRQDDGAIATLTLNRPKAYNALSLGLMNAVLEALAAIDQETCSQMMLAIPRLRQPVIAKVQGIATAAGCQVVATCDLAIASDTAKFGTPGVNIGLFCSTPMVALSRAVHRKQAMEMLLTGELISAEKAVSIGLINRAVPEDALAAETKALADVIASKSHKVLKTGKEAFHRQIEMSLEQAYTYTGGVMVENMSYSDSKEGIDAFINKRPPLWTHE